MSLHDDQPLDLKEQRAIGAAFTTPEADRWWSGLPETTRKAIMQKLLGALAKADSPRDIGSLTRSLMKADELDLKRTQRPSGVTHNTQVNIDARGGPAEMFRSLIDEVRSLDTSRVTSTVDRHDVPAEHPVKAPAEPAGDNQP